MEKTVDDTYISTYHELHTYLSNRIQTRKQFLRWLKNNWSGKEKMESCLNLFAIIGVIPQLRDHRVCIGNFNEGTIKTCVDMKRLLSQKVKAGGDISDLTLITRDDRIRAFTAKNLTDIGVTKMDLMAIAGQHTNCKYTRELCYGICVKDKKILLEKAITCDSSSVHESDVIMNTDTVILDFEDLADSFTVLKRYSSFNPDRKVLIPYFHQELCATRICDKLEQDKPVVCNALPRSGKTMIMGRIIQLLENANNVLLLTLCPGENIDSYRSFFETYNFSKYNLVFLHEIKAKQPLLKANNIIVASKQYLQGKVEKDIDATTTAKKTTIKWLQSMSIDLLLIDEPHTGGTTSLATSVYHTYGRGSKVVYVTATSTKPVVGYSIPNEQIVGWDLEDVRLCRGIDDKSNRTRIVEKYGPICKTILKKYSKRVIKETYNRYPTMIFANTSFKPAVKKEIIDDNGGWSLMSLFMLKKPKKVEGEKAKKPTAFINEQQVVSFFHSIFGENKQRKKYKKTCGESIFGKICHASGSRFANSMEPLVILAFIDPNSVNVLGNILVSLFKKYNILPDYEIILTCGGSNRGQKSIDILEKTLEKARNNGKKGVLVFTGRMLSTGVTIKKCDMAILLDNTKSWDFYYQRIYRPMTEDTDKQYGYVFDFNIHRVHQFIVTTATTLSPDKTTKKAIEYVLNSGIIELNGTGMWYNDTFGVHNPDNELIANYIHREWMMDISATQSLINSFQTLSITSTDTAMFNSIFTNKSGKSPKSSVKKGKEINEDAVNEATGGKDRDLDTGVKIDEQSTGDKDEEKQKEERESMETADMFNKVFKYMVVFSVVLTIDDESSSFVEMCKIIDKNRYKRSTLLSQLRSVWGNEIPDDVCTVFINTFINNNLEKLSDVITSIKLLKERFTAVLQHPHKFYRLIEEYLVPHDTERRNNAEISTPPKLRKEMLDNIPVKLWSKKVRVFEPCSGKGGFLIDIVDRFMTGLSDRIPDASKRYKFIVEKMIYFADINPLNIFICKLLLNPLGKYKLNYYVGDTLLLNPSDEWSEVDKFNIIIGNPPYSTDPSKQNTKALYNLFIQKYIDTTSYFMFVVPSKWFSGGKGLDKFRKFMLSRNDISLIEHRDNCKDWFPDTEIKGGVNYFLKCPKPTKCKFNGVMTQLDKYDILVDPKYLTLVDKFKEYPTISSIFMTAGYYKVRTNDKRLHDEEDDNTVTCYVSLLKKADRKRYIKKSDCKVLDTQYKVITSEASGKGRSGFGFKQVIRPVDIYTDSYIGFKTDSNEEGESLVSYLNCKLPNVMLAIRKITQHINTSTVKWIPLPPLDRVWDDKKVCEYFNVSMNELEQLL